MLADDDGVEKKTCCKGIRDHSVDTRVPMMICNIVFLVPSVVLVGLFFAATQRVSVQEGVETTIVEDFMNEHLWKLVASSALNALLAVVMLVNFWAPGVMGAILTVGERCSYALCLGPFKAVDTYLSKVLSSIEICSLAPHKQRCCLDAIAGILLLSLSGASAYPWVSYLIHGLEEAQIEAPPSKIAAMALATFGRLALECSVPYFASIAVLLSASVLAESISNYQPACLRNCQQRPRDERSIVGAAGGDTYGAASTGRI